MSPRPASRRSPRRPGPSPAAAVVVVLAAMLAVFAAAVLLLAFGPSA